MPLILVTGATGIAGSQVVQQLSARGAPVRAFVRDADKARRVLGSGVELAIGDLADTDSFTSALDGVVALMLSCADDPRRVAWETSAIDAAVAAGVECIVKLSTIGAAPGSPVAFWDWHGQVEQHLRGSNLDWVVLRSSFYMTNLLASADHIARDGRILAPAGAARIAMVDPSDVAAAVAAVLVDGGHEHETIVLTGPEAITYQRVAAELTAATGRQTEFVDVPPAAARQGLVASGVPEFVAEQLVALFGQLQHGAAEQVTDGVEMLVGRPARYFAEFARAPADAFAPTPVTAT